MALFVLVCVRVVFSQAATGAISGTVTNAAGAAVPGASVTNLDTTLGRTVVADERGRYRATDLRAGVYLVRAESSEFDAAVKRDVRVAAGATAPVDLVLPARATGSDAPKLSFSSPLAAPGERAVVRVRLDGTPDKSIVGLTLNVEFPGALLQFVEARPAFLLQDTLSLTATLAPAADTEVKRQLAVTATSTQPIAPGDAFELLFDVSRAVYTDQEAVVAARSGSLRTAGGPPVDKLAFEPGKVRISMASVVFACFFYMH